MATGQVPEARQEAVSEAAAQTAEPPSDAQLLANYVKNRDEEAFTALVQRYGSLVLGVCERILQDRHDAEDAFQATFLVLVRRAAGLDGERSLGNWLYAVAYRTALKAKTLAAKRRARERQAFDMLARPSAADPELSDLRPIIDQALNELPEKYRAPLVLCFLQGKTHQEAAQELGWPTGSMSRRMERARKLLRRRLARRGVILGIGAATMAGLVGQATASAVPASLITSTAKAAMAFGAGAAATAGAISSDVVTLAEAVIRSTSVFRLKVSAGFVTALALITVLSVATMIYCHIEVPDQAPSTPRYFSYKVRSTGPGGSLAGWQLRGSLGQSDLGEIVSLAVAPNNKILVSTSRDENWIRTWELATGREQQRLQGHTASIPAVAFSPDGKRLASASEDSTIKLWDVVEGRLVDTLRGHGAGVLAVAFSPDGKLLASAGLDETVRVWDAATRKTRWVLTGHAGPVLAVAFSPDSRSIASGGKGGFPKVWDLATGAERLTLDAHAGPVSALAFSPDGKMLASGSWDHTIKLWEMPSGRLITALHGHADQVRGLAFTPSGKLLVSAGKDKTVKVWHVAEQSELASLQGHTASVNCLILGRDFTMTTGSADQTIRFWIMDERLQELE